MDAFGRSIFRPSEQNKEQKVDELIEAAKTGDIEKLINIVSKNELPVDSRHPLEGPTPLYWAACNGHVNVCSWLVSQKADLNFTLPISGSAPLHAAADRGHYNCVLLLICRGANINMRTANNWDTPMHLAAYRGYATICSLLLDHGANVFLLNKQGRTPLDEACIKGNVQIVQMITKRHKELLDVKIPAHDVATSKHEVEKEKNKSRYASNHSVSYNSEEFDDRIGIHQFASPFGPTKTTKSEFIQWKSKGSQKDVSDLQETSKFSSKTGSLTESPVSKSVDEFDSISIEENEKDNLLAFLNAENEKLRKENKHLMRELLKYMSRDFAIS